MMEHPDYPRTLGATYVGDGRCRFLVWEPRAESLELKLLGTRERLLDSADPQRNGSGAAFPPRIDSAGEVSLRAAPRAVAVYKQLDA